MTSVFNLERATRSHAPAAPHRSARGALYCTLYTCTAIARPIAEFDAAPRMRDPHSVPFHSHTWHSRTRRPGRVLSRVCETMLTVCQKFASASRANDNENGAERSTQLVRPVPTCPSRENADARQTLASPLILEARRLGRSLR